MSTNNKKVVWCYYRKGMVQLLLVQAVVGGLLLLA